MSNSLVRMKTHMLKSSVRYKFEDKEYDELNHWKRKEVTLVGRQDKEQYQYNTLEELENTYQKKLTF